MMTTSVRIQLLISLRQEICLDSDELEEMRGRNEDYETIFDMKVEDIKESIHTTRNNLGKTRHYQLMAGADMSQVVKTLSLSTTFVLTHSGHKPCKVEHGGDQLLVFGSSLCNAGHWSDPS